MHIYMEKKMLRPKSLEISKCLTTTEILEEGKKPGCLDQEKKMRCDKIIFCTCVQVVNTRKLFKE